MRGEHPGATAQRRAALLKKRMTFDLEVDVHAYAPNTQQHPTEVYVERPRIDVSRRLVLDEEKDESIKAWLDENEYGYTEEPHVFVIWKIGKRCHPVYWSEYSERGRRRAQETAAQRGATK